MANSESVSFSKRSASSNFLSSFSSDFISVNKRAKIKTDSRSRKTLNFESFVVSSNVMSSILIVSNYLFLIKLSVIVTIPDNSTFEIIIDSKGIRNKDNF